jgi:hypothetical protein
VQHPIDGAKLKLFSENKKLKLKVFLNRKRDKRNDCKKVFQKLARC